MVRLPIRPDNLSMPHKPSHVSLHWAWLIVLIVGLDQATKQLVVSLLQPDRSMVILPSVEFVLSYNKGISFSFLRFVDDAQRWPLVGLSALASGLLGWWLARVPSGKPVLAIGLTLIIGGALGNMLDRARIGSVIDFVHVSYKDWSFAIFNLADAAITSGAIAALVSPYLETPDVYADRERDPAN
ncbi:signal peptidase II [Bradyrhizobium septentrionale]|uniref:Lipoprotein signal peptidase n=1 Tax=Bradyrhizobium septentrionale TaxID=1404411 RepID=A0A973ZZT4_9BRAD|nr:signal peptidase II [Bradyrhizobium septentrionale]UGY20055.1 signal peptidase II [Bradyrhizobium septentrionale]UGY28837.1 signal peptidase II [Bradyrhizobium septentrionale]